MQFKYYARKLSVFFALLTVLSLFATMTASAHSLADSSAPFATDVSYLNDPLYIGITIVFPNGVPSPILGGAMGGAWFHCSIGVKPNTVYCWGHGIGEYPATLYLANGLTNIIPVTVPAPPSLPNKPTPPPCEEQCCGSDC